MRGSDKNVLVSMEIKFPTTILKLLFTTTKLFRIFFMHTKHDYCELLQQCIFKMNDIKSTLSTIP